MPATVTVTVAGPVIWFVDDLAPVTGNGTLGNPFQTLAEAVTAVGANVNQRIFLYDGTYAGGVPLNAQGWLIGQPSTGVDFDTLMGILPPAGTIPRPSIASPGVVIVQGTVTLATDAKVQGIVIDTTLVPADGLTDPLAAITGVSVTESRVTTTTGTALLLSDVAGTITLTDLDKNGTGTGISLTNVDAAVTIPLGATIAATDVAGVAITGGTGAFTYGGTISNSAGRTVSVINRSGTSTATFSGQVTSTGGTSTGVLLDNNDGGATDSKVTFSGGLDVTTAGANPAITATNGGAVEVTGLGNTITTGTGAGLTMTGTNAGALGVTFDSIQSTSGPVATIVTSAGSKILGEIDTSSGAATALNLDNAATGAGSSVTVGHATNASALATTTGTGINVVATALNFVGVAVDITKTGAGSALVVNNSTLTNAGLVTDGIDITTTGGGTGLSVTGGTVNITGGGLTIDTDDASDGPGVVATTAGTTLTVQGTTNTIISGSQTALNVSTATIGASGLTFQSIASNGSSSGIVLNNTGSGGLTVTGDAGSTNNGSGGTIQNTTGHGISLATTQNVSLDQMSIQGTGGSGINGTAVTNFSFTNGTISDSGNAVGEGNIAFNSGGNNLSGTLTLTGSTLTNGFDSGLEVENNAGTISNAVIQNNTVTSTTSTVTSKGDGIKLVGTGTGGAVSNLTKATISGNTVRNFPSGAGIRVSYGNGTGPGATAGTPGSGTNIVSITNNTVRGQSSSNQFGTSAIIIEISGGNAGSRSQGNFDVSNNGTVAQPIGDALGHVILIGNNGFATMTATVNNNVIVANNTVGSPGIGGGNGVSVGCAADRARRLT